MRYRCGRCHRVLSGAVVEDHARNAHFVEPRDIDFSPVMDLFIEDSYREEIR